MQCVCVCVCVRICLAQALEKCRIMWNYTLGIPTPRRSFVCVCVCVCVCLCHVSLTGQECLAGTHILSLYLSHTHMRLREAHILPEGFVWAMHTHAHTHIHTHTHTHTHTHKHTLSLTQIRTPQLS